MIDFTETTIELVAVHGIGSKSNEEGLKLSTRTLDLTDNPVNDVLQNYFCKPFKNNPYNQFCHDTDINLNEIYTYAKAIFADPYTLLIQSVNIAKHLYDCSDHPQIKSGELYVVYFRNCYVDCETTDAIGIFKSENKDVFLKVYEEQSNLNVASEQGIDIRKLDKGCLIFNLESEHGYLACAVDNTNKNEEARFWVDNFLRVRPREDDYHHTHTYMDMTKSFVKEVFNKAHNVNKPDQIDLLNRSCEYFLNNNRFVQEDFEQNVIAEPAVIEAFKEYKEQYAEDKQIDLTEANFDIDEFAVKKNKGQFKSTLKLDKNFHIYIHGDRQMLERGWDDEKQMNFYKLYFTDEN